MMINRETDPIKAAKRLKNNEAARRYRERKRRQLELKQKCWEALQRDHSALFKQLCSRRKSQKWWKLIKSDRESRKWKNKLTREYHS